MPSMTVFSVPVGSGVVDKGHQLPTTVTESGGTQAPPVEEEQNQVDIPGIRNVWGSKYTLIGKCVWLAILVTCTIIMLIQVLNRFHYYLSLPVNVEMKLRNNDSMHYPDITICNSEFFKKDAYYQIQVEVGNKSGVAPASVSINDILKYMTPYEMYERTAYSLSELVKSVWKPCTSSAAWVPVISTAGVCYTLKFNSSTTVSGSVYGINMIMATTKPNKTDSWKILLHEQRSPPKTKVYTEGININANYSVDIRVQLKRYRLLSTPSKYCSDIPKSTCMINCLTALVIDKLNCRLPFMEDVDIDFCEGSDFKVADDMVKNVLLGNTHNCTCSSACNSDSYEAGVDTTYYPDRTFTRVRIFYDTFVYIKVGEEFSYGLVPLLSDIGGTLGLFLGFSLLNIAELLETIYSRLKKKYLKPKDKPGEFLENTIEIESTTTSEKEKESNAQLTKI